MEENSKEQIYRVLRRFGRLDSREGEEVDDFLALELNRRKEFLEKIVIEKTAALAQSGPEGRLRCVDRNGRPEYYWRKDGKDVTGAYIPVGKREFAAALAQKNYDQAVLNYAKEELRLIKQLAKKRAAHNIEISMRNMDLPGERWSILFGFRMMSLSQSGSRRSTRKEYSRKGSLNSLPSEERGSCQRQRS